MNILSGEKLTPQEWCVKTGIEILDHDGWDRKVFEVDWLIPLTRDEFLGKAFLSTCHKWPHPLLDEEKVTWEKTGENKFKLLDPYPEDSVAADNVVPLLTAINGLFETPEIKGLREASMTMYSMYEALVEAGFTEAQALTLVGQIAVGIIQ